MQEVKMGVSKEIDISRFPGVRVFVAREEALVAEEMAAAEVRIETRQRIGLPAHIGDPLPPPIVTQSCEGTRTWTISGSHTTGSNGKAIIHLDRFLSCVPWTIEGTRDRNFLGGWPSFTATPEATEPIFLTCAIDAVADTQHFVPQQLTVTVTVMSWRHDGAPAPDTAFNWIAIAREAVSIGG